MSAISAMMDAGRPEPMGAHARDGGVNFAVFSQHAERIDVCVFDAAGEHETLRFSLRGPRDAVFSGFLPGAGPGLVYGLRAFGPYCPERGLLFNPNKLLLDPCAREIVGEFAWHPAQHGYVAGGAEGLHAPDSTDNSGVALKARVAAEAGPAPGWFNAPCIPDADVVLYEVHVKGFSMQHLQVPPALRGTYAGLAHPAAIEHFKALGVTTLSLLPVHYCLDEAALRQRGLCNYWGYNTLGFFCPDPRLASCGSDPTDVAEEFRQMVDTLHRHGLEVVLDVVYNHTPEGSELGPTISFRGLDNASWYRLQPGDASHCENLTGCGNTLNVAHPKVTQFVLDSLRYWLRDMGVDGFRFDLAPVLGRGAHGFDSDAAFFTALRQDPVLARARLIAEPWDAGPNGYQVGRFPGRFLDWNDKFRDAVRGYWLGRRVSRGEFARRFAASDDLFAHDQRTPTASVNFIGVHDGFTLADLVSYSRKHNLANGEDNRDGRDEELSDNCGVEGPTDDLAITAFRLRLRRAMVATLLLAQGTPMLCAGDEFGNSQQGNNNAYCQDNAVGWLDWPAADLAFTRFVASVIALRAAEPLLHHDQWFNWRHQANAGATLLWSMPDGSTIGPDDWHDSDGGLGCRLFESSEAAFAGEAARATLMLMFNPLPQQIDFVLPLGHWRLALDSSVSMSMAATLHDSVAVPAKSLLLLRPIFYASESLP